MSESYRRAFERSSFGTPEVAQARKIITASQRESVLKKIEEKRRSTRKKGGLYDKKCVRIGGIDADKDIKTTHL
ncbi:hypothetical protein QP952_08495 [Corynebacterium pseudodiphtheriticum]|uniref:hypothetical protein n=1 Tax=Corynebacterium pseudodiphtheriticum TaxID=37637 RepID=UPI0025506932|nr:hypothetical protein [Corynebacterium pseudodiphtheriticum]MDK8709709.1 hypothetical protein [Corynebacterium pseudodiphtheriticum]